MRIVVLDPGGYTAHYDGNLCYELARLGHDVRLDTSRFLFENVEPLGGYEVRNRFFNAVRGPITRWAPARQALKALTYPLELAWWARSVAADPPDVLHVQWSLLPPLDLRVLRRLRRHDLRLVVTVHEIPATASGPWLGAFGGLLRMADAVVVHAERQGLRLVEELGVPERRVRVAPMGSIGRYAGPDVPRTEARRRLGLREDVPLAVLFGLIKPYKGLDTLLDALAVARRTLPTLELLVAGHPMHGWRDYEEQIERLGLVDAVHLRLGFVPSDEVNVVFGAADAVVAPYKRAAQSMVVRTAIQYGKPVVATGVGGLPELVRDGVNGLLAKPGDSHDLARAMVEAFSDAERLRRMGEAARDLTNGSYSWEAIAALHERIYAGEAGG